MMSESTQSNFLHQIGDMEDKTCGETKKIQPGTKDVTSKSYIFCEQSVEPRLGIKLKFHN